MTLTPQRGTPPTMTGELSGVILDAARTPKGELTLRLAGITANDAGGVTWIRNVTFLPAHAPATPPTAGNLVRVSCIATHRVFQGRSGDKASEVAVYGTRLTLITGQVVTKGEGRFLQNATNRFTFAGHLTGNPARASHAPKVTARLGVTDRRDHTHYFNLEAWRGNAGSLAHYHRGAELEATCILRRDRAKARPGEQVRTWDVMEVVGLRAVRLPTRTLPLPERMPNAAD